MNNYIDTPPANAHRMFQVLTDHFTNVITELLLRPEQAQPTIRTEVEDGDGVTGRDRLRDGLKNRGDVIRRGELFDLNVSHAFALLRSGGGG